MSPKIQNDGSIYHCNAVRVLATGNCNLRMRLLALPDNDGNQISKTLIPLEITTATARIKERRANFKTQRMQLEIKTTAINETFRISSVILFLKYSAAGYPG